MLLDGNESVLDRLTLNKTRLEGYIACGMKSGEILTVYNKTGAEMDEWCMKEYGMPWKTVFELVRQVARGEYLDTVKDLGLKGNPTALSIVDKVINNENADETTGMVFNVNVKVETNDDKEC